MTNIVSNNKANEVDPYDSEDEFVDVVDDEVAGVAEKNLPQDGATKPPAPLDANRLKLDKKFNISAAFSPDQGLVTSLTPFRTTIEISGQTFGIVLKKGLPPNITRELAKKFFKVSLLDLESQGKLPKEGKSMGMLISNLTTTFQLMASNGQLEEIERTSDRIEDLNTSYRKGDVARLESAINRFENEVLNSPSKSVNFNAPLTIEHREGKNSCYAETALDGYLNNPDLCSKTVKAIKQIDSKDKIEKKEEKKALLQFLQKLQSQTSTINKEQLKEFQTLFSKVVDKTNSLAKANNTETDDFQSMLTKIEEILLEIVGPGPALIKTSTAANGKTKSKLENSNLITLDPSKGTSIKELSSSYFKEKQGEAIGEKRKETIDGVPEEITKEIVQFEDGPSYLSYQINRLSFDNQNNKGIRNTSPVFVNPIIDISTKKGQISYIPSTIYLHDEKANHYTRVIIKYPPSGEPEYYHCGKLTGGPAPQKIKAEDLPNFYKTHASQICRVDYIKQSIIDDATKAAQQPAQQNNAAKASEAKADAKAKEVLPPAAPGPDQPKLAPVTAPTQTALSNGSQSITPSTSTVQNSTTKANTLTFRVLNKAENVGEAGLVKKEEENIVTIHLNNDDERVIPYTDEDPNQRAFNQNKFNEYIEEAFKQIHTADPELTKHSKVRFVIDRNLDSKGRELHPDAENRFQQFTKDAIAEFTQSVKSDNDDEVDTLFKHTFKEIEVVVMPPSDPQKPISSTQPKSTLITEGGAKRTIDVTVEQYASNKNIKDVNQNTVKATSDTLINEISQNNYNEDLTILVEGKLSTEDCFKILKENEIPARNLLSRLRWSIQLRNLRIIVVPPPKEPKED